VQLVRSARKLKRHSPGERRRANEQLSCITQFIVSVVKPKPDNFNSGVGLMVVDQLNTAYQNALACEINSQINLGAAVVLKDGPPPIEIHR
jgi:hypothetical protein